MWSGNKVVQGVGGYKFISIPGADDFIATAPKGSINIRLDVPTGCFCRAAGEADSK